MSVAAFDASSPAAKGPGAPTGNELRVVEAEQYTTVTRGTSPTTSGGTIATLALGDKVTIQNLNTSALFVKKGASAAADSYDYVLAAGDANDDGKGGVIDIKDFVGVISVYGSTYRFVWHKSAA